MRPSAPPRVSAASFCNARQMDLVLDRAVLEPARRGLLQQGEALRRGRRHRLLGIDVLAGGDRLLEHADALLGRRRIEEDRIGGVGQRGVEIGGPIRDLVGARHRGQAIGIAADQQQSRQQPIVAERQTAFAR